MFMFNQNRGNLAHLLAECTQLEDPRLEWRAIQEAMLREYLQTAQDVLEVSKFIGFSSAVQLPFVGY
jgi:hypothetical protein